MFLRFFISSGRCLLRDAFLIFLQVLCLSVGLIVAVLVGGVGRLHTFSGVVDLADDRVEELGDPFAHTRHEPAEDFVGLRGIVVSRPVRQIVLLLGIFVVDKNLVPISLSLIC